MNLLIVKNLTFVVYALVAAIVVLLGMLAGFICKVNKLQAKYDFLVDGKENVNIEGLLNEALAVTRTNVQELQKVNGRCEQLETSITKNVEEITAKFEERCDSLQDNLLQGDRTLDEKFENRCDGLREHLHKCVQQVHTVRFNAFDNTGSDLSYSVALLDEDNNGVVISSIYGRDESRTYAKPIVNKESTYKLSKEEIQALSAK